MKNFYNLIKELHENKISVVVFTPPHHKSFLENISISEQQDLRSLILNTTNNFELNFYNFTYKYQDLEIDPESSPQDILKNFASYADIKIHNTVVCILDRPRHKDLIQKVRSTGARIKFIL